MEDYIPISVNIIERLAYACNDLSKIELTKEELDTYFTKQENYILYPLYDGDNAVSAKYGIQYKHIHDFKSFNVIVNLKKGCSIENLLKKVDDWAKHYDIDIHIDIKYEMEEL